MRNSRIDLIALFLFLISFALRLALISKGPYHLDCLNLAIQAEHTLNTYKLHYLFGVGYPFTVILGAVFIFFARMFGITDPVIAVNFMSVVFGSLSVPILYLIVKKLFDRTAAIFSAFTFSVLPIFLALSTYGKSHTPAIFLMLLTIYLLLKSESSESKYSIIFPAIAAGLMGATRIQDLILMGPAFSFMIAAGIASPASKEVLAAMKRILIFWGIAALIAFSFHVPLILKSFARYQHQAQVFWDMGVTRNFRGLISPALWSVYFTTMANFTAGGALFAIGGLVLLWIKSTRLAIGLTLWLVIPLLFYGNLLSSVPRFFVLSYPPLLISLGYILSYMVKKHRTLKLPATLFFCVIIFLMFWGIHPILKFRHTHQALPNYCLMVKNLTPSNAAVIVADDDLFVQYYSKRKTVPQLNPYVSTLDKDSLNAYKTMLHEKYLNQNIPLYITEGGLWMNNRQDKKRRFISFMYSQFNLEMVAYTLSEDWHHGENFLQVGQARLWRVWPKKEN